MSGLHTPYGLNHDYGIPSLTINYEDHLLGTGQADSLFKLISAFIQIGNRLDRAGCLDGWDDLNEQVTFRRSDDEDDEWVLFPEESADLLTIWSRWCALHVAHQWRWGVEAASEIELREEEFGYWASFRSFFGRPWPDMAPDEMFTLLVSSIWMGAPVKGGEIVCPLMRHISNTIDDLDRLPFAADASGDALEACNPEESDVILWGALNAAHMTTYSTGNVGDPENLRMETPAAEVYFQEGLRSLLSLVLYIDGVGDFVPSPHMDHWWYLNVIAHLRPRWLEAANTSERLARLRGEDHMVLRRALLEGWRLNNEPDLSFLWECRNTGGVR